MPENALNGGKNALGEDQERLSKSEQETRSRRVSNHCGFKESSDRLIRSCYPGAGNRVQVPDGVLAIFHIHFNGGWLRAGTTARPRRFCNRRGVGRIRAGLSGCLSRGADKLY